MRGNENLKLYLEITQDEYQLPLKVAESTKELAKMCGMERKQLQNYIGKVTSGQIKKPRFIKVVVDD